MNQSIVGSNFYQGWHELSVGDGEGQLGDKSLPQPAAVHSMSSSTDIVL